MRQPKKCPVCNAAMWFAGDGQAPFPGMGGKWHAWQCKECGAVLNTMNRDRDEQPRRPEWIQYMAAARRHEWEASGGQKEGAMERTLVESARMARQGFELLGIKVSVRELIEATKTPGRPMQLEAEE
jgi:hypothetical protein